MNEYHFQPQNMNLSELADKVDSKQALLEFIRALADSASAAGSEPAQTPDGKLNLSPGGWENGNIADFLYTMNAWGLGNSGITGQPHIPEEPSWHSFAKILHSGKFYE